jgi:hypothetical protein
MGNAGWKAGYQVSDQDNFTGNPFADGADNFKGDPFAAPQAAPKPQQSLEQILGPSDFTKSFASTPYRMLKSGMQMVGAGDYVPGIVNEIASEGDKSVAGRIAGDVAGTGGIRAAGVGLAQTLARLNAARGVVPAVARTAEAATYGAGQGAITSPDQQAEAAKWGAAGGAGGHALSRAIGGLVRPSVAAQPLVDAGVALTPGQAAGKGSVMKWAEEMATSLPFAGHTIRSAQSRAVADANVAAAQQVMNIVDRNIKLGQPPREAIEATREAIGKTYDRALEGMSVPGFVPDTFMRNVYNRSANDFPMLEKAQIDQMERYITQRVGDMVKNSGGTLDGKMLKQLDSELGGHIRNLRSSAIAADKTAAPAWAELQQSLREVMELAQNDPAQSLQLQRANAAYRQLLTLEKSLLPGADVFTPRQLARQVGKEKLNEVPLGQISRSMTDTLPNVVPNSGTPERLMAMALPAVLVGGGAGAQQMGFDTLGAGMIGAAALGSRPGARFMTGGLPMQQLTAEALRRFVPSTVRNFNQKKNDERK